MPGPCPCMSLQRGSMAVAVVDAVIQMLAIILYIVAMVAITKDPDGKYTDDEQSVAVGVGAVRILVCVIKIWFAFWLYGAARDQNYRRCRTWLIISFVIFAFLLIAIIVNNTASDFNGSAFAASIIDILYRAYEMWVVWMFIREIQWEGGNTGGGGGAPSTHPGPIFVTPQNGPIMQQININS